MIEVQGDYWHLNPIKYDKQIRIKSKRVKKKI